MARPAPFHRDRRQAIRLTILRIGSKSANTLTLSVDPDTTSPFGRATTHPTCALAASAQIDARFAGHRRRAQFLSTIVSRHLPGLSIDTSQTLSVRSTDPDTMQPFGRMSTHNTCASRRRQSSDALFYCTLVPHPVLMPAQRLETVAGRRFPQLERAIFRP